VGANALDAARGGAWRASAPVHCCGLSAEVTTMNPTLLNAER
jgi:hypothetical protein